MGVIVGLVPAVFWGVLPLWLRRFTGGSFRSQLLGTALGIVLMAAGIHMIMRPALSAESALLFLLSGFCWSFGQAGQYYCYERLGVSVTMPLSTALQLIGNSIIGGLFFGEWLTGLDVLMSFAALLTLVVGVFVAHGRKDSGLVSVGSSDVRTRWRAYAVLLLTTAGYWLYSAFPLMAAVEGKLDGFLPQAVGMTISAALIAVTRPHEMLSRRTVVNVSSGLIFSVAAATYLLAMSMIGMVNAFVLSQLNVVVSTLIGGLVLHEFNRDSIPRIAAGLSVLMGGAVMMVAV